MTDSTSIRTFCVSVTFSTKRIPMRSMTSAIGRTMRKIQRQAR